MTLCANPACGSEFERKPGRGRPQLICDPCRIQAGRLKPDLNNSASTIKRFRRNKAAVTSIRDAIRDVLEEDHPQTVRQVFYALTVRGVIKKAEIEYQQTVIRLLVQMREDGDIPFGWIADNTRWQRKPSTFVGLNACLRNTAKFYRRDLWAAMPVYVEVWCEKDALAGVLLEETEPYDVPLMVAKGYSSISFLHSAADIALQFGVPLEVIRKALMRDSHGRSRTPLGAALDKIAADQA